MQDPQTPERIISIAELARRTSLSVATIYRLMPDALERPRKVSPGRVGWSSSYIDNWLSARLSPASGSTTTQAAA
jgi:predicted DNA-binding transcriptional regulator AlpA